MSFTLSKNIWLPLLIVAAGVLLGYHILGSAKLQQGKQFKKNKGARIRIVQTEQLTKGSVEPFWNTSGFVKPAESVKVYAKISGNIDAINQFATPGGRLEKDQWLVKLDRQDFELALRSQQALLEQANASFSLEKANQILAKEELTLLSKNTELSINESLVLREPQLIMAKSKVTVAKINLEKARVNMERTTVFMPFDGKITAKQIGHGSTVSANSVLFSVVNTDKYWLEVKIPHKFLTLFDKRKLADVSQTRLWGDDKLRQAKFVSILPELDNKDRQVRVLLAIDDPLAQSLPDQPEVFINDFLNVQLKGKAINNAWTIKHSWLQHDNSIWVVDQHKTLQKRPVDVLFKGRDLIYVRSDIQLGDRALSEKPGLASIGLPVHFKKSLAELNNKAKNLEKMGAMRKAKLEKKRAMLKANTKRNAKKVKGFKNEN
jgi:RND family efflux transporter MFP subunit